MSISEQLSAARQNQIEAQLAFFNSFASKAVASTEKLIALNLNLTRETVEKSSAAMHRALTAQNPGELLALGTRTPDTITSLMAYGRELMSIATGFAPTVPVTAPAAEPKAVTPAAPPAIAHEVVSQSIPAAAPVAEPEVLPNVATAESTPPLAVNPVAQALAGSNPVPAPAAAPLAVSDTADLQFSGIKPVEASPPPAPVAGTPEVVQETAAAKSRKKK